MNYVGHMAFMFIGIQMHIKVLYVAFKLLEERYYLILN